MSMEPWLARHRAEVATPFEGVRLHRIDLTTARPDAERWVALLAADERERAALFRLDDDRLRYAVTRATLRMLLAEAGLGPPECLTIVAGPHGKPELAHPSTLRFNVAHSGDVALIALAEGCEVGVDVEVVRSRSDLHAVARRFFTAAEAGALAALDGDASAAAFHRCWVRKEACLKATGLGLRLALDAFEVGVDVAPPAPRIVTLPVPDGPARCRLADVDVAPGHAAALAVREGGSEPR
jgi:4'-phosphopantetheinyl transferase